jgi:hypothetical protein
MSSRVVLLDVDGVLTHAGSVPNGRASKETGSFYYKAMIDPACASRLVRILDGTDAIVVLASAWRRYTDHVNGLRRALLDAGLSRSRASFVERTGQRNDVQDGEVRRYTECLDWLRIHPEVTRVLCLDDGWVSPDWAFDPLPNHFSGGLLDLHVAPAIAWLAETTPNRDGRPPSGRAR